MTMRIDIVTLFPEVCKQFLNESILGRAVRRGFIDIRCHQLRDYSPDRLRRVDDTPYGGGKGMLMQAEPFYRACTELIGDMPQRPHIIYMSPKGKTFNQKRAIELSKLPNLLILCGHYEGVDQRFIDEMVDEEISIGDYVLTGGELGAMVVADSVLRLCDGVLSDESCYMDESHHSGLLEYPHYTRPGVWNGREVPEVLLSGHHANIERWRRDRSLELTYQRRPDMLENVQLSKKDIDFLNKLKEKDSE